MSKQVSKRQNKNSQRKGPFSVPRTPDKVGNSVYRTIQWAFHSTFTNSITTDTFYALSFKLTDLSNYADWLTVYDQYRIVNVEVHLIPTTYINTTVVTNRGVLWTCIDYDDDTAFTSVNDIVQFNNAHVHINDGTRKLVVINPHVALGVNSGGLVASGNVKSIWIDASSPNVNHYGFKAVMTTGAGGTLTYYVATRMIVEFRNAK
jgi:hypothetical protein